jgi:hypothetical protein
MLARLIHSPAQWGVLAAQLVLSGFVFSAEGRGSMLVGSTLMLAIGLPAWLSAFRHARDIGDTPTSRVASAAQGYVELQGRARSLAGVPVRSPLTGLVCLWYRYEVQRRQDNRWVPDGAGESDDSFILDDGSGQCLIDPEGATIVVSRRDRWRADGRRYTQWTLLDNDPLYAIGNFATRGTAELDASANEDVKALLDQWKRDRPQLLERFDLDRDGDISLREWELARRQARREVEKTHREARANAELHLLRRPDDGRAYILSSFAPQSLARRFHAWAAAHLAVVIAGTLGFAYAWQLS